MKKLVWLALVVSIGCGGEPGDTDGGQDASSRDAGIDAPSDAGADLDSGIEDAGVDAPSDAGTDAATDAESDAGTDAGTDAGFDAATCPTPLLIGGTDITAQGWNTVMQAPATLTYGADHVQLQTTTTSGGSTSGQLLLVRPDALMPGMPFRLEVVMQVEAVSPHNALDSGAAILGSFTPPFGNATDRSQMIYLDPAAVGWSDDTASHARSITDGAYHTYVLAVDAAGTATLTIDGTAALTRSGYTTTGTIAIGDQTNDPNVDATTRIRSVTLLCP